MIQHFLEVETRLSAQLTGFSSVADGEPSSTQQPPVAVPVQQARWGRRTWHKYFSFHKRETQKPKKHLEEVEQKKLLAVLVLGQQCMLGNYTQKENMLDFDAHKYHH